MKIKHAMASILAFSFFVLMTGCSGNKKEAAENHEDHDMMESSKDVSTTMDVKAFENVDGEVKSQINGFLSDYFALNQSLIEDNEDGAKVAAKKFVVTVGKFDMSKLNDEQMEFYHTQMAKLNEGLKGIEQSADIEETRMELSTVSDGMYALVKAFHPNDAELYYQFCPMAKNGEGANWLSSTKEIVNPYMGQRMLKCGKTQETLN
jgi:Cu(I)/Ag(I) efflux system membrane fusion protein